MFARIPSKERDNQGNRDVNNYKTDQIFLGKDDNQAIRDKMDCDQ